MEGAGRRPRSDRRTGRRAGTAGHRRGAGPPAGPCPKRLRRTTTMIQQRGSPGRDRSSRTVGVTEGDHTGERAGGHRRGCPRRPRRPRSRSSRWPRSRRRARTHRRPLPVMPSLLEPGVHVIAEVKRASPSKGALATIADPAELAVAVRGRWRQGHLGAHRAAPVRRLAGRPGRGAGGRRHPGAAQGLHRQPVPGARGQGPRRRPRAADRRRARAAGVARSARTGRVARHDRAGRGAHRGRGRPGADRRREGHRHQRPRPDDPDRRPGRVLPDRARAAHATS